MRRATVVADGAVAATTTTCVDSADEREAIHVAGSNGKGSPDVIKEMKKSEAGDLPRGKVFFINNLKSCDDDIKILSDTFSKRGYEIVSIKESVSYEELKERVKESQNINSCDIIAFFFGYGFGDFIFLGDENHEDIVSYREFCKIFRMYRDKSTAVFTNTCFKSNEKKNISPVTTPDDLRNTFHLCIKVNGQCGKGSLLTRALLREFQESKLPMLDFTSLSNKINFFIKEKQEEVHITCIWLYGVIGTFQVWNNI